MDIKLIKSIVNNNLLSNDAKEDLIIEVIAKSENAIPTVLSILNAERNNRNSLIDELNRLLSKAHIGLTEPQFNKDNFIEKEIEDFYKNNDINHVFKNIHEDAQ